MSMFDCPHCGDTHHVNDFCATGPMSQQTAPSNANTSGLEVVAWRMNVWVADGIGTGWMLSNHQPEPNHQPTDIEPLVTAASAQAAIDAEKARIATILEGECKCCVLTRAQCADTVAAIEIGRKAEKARADRLETNIRFRNERWSAVAARAEKLEQALIEALPYVESCEYDNGYKPGVVLRVVKNIQSALQQETQP